MGMGRRGSSGSLTQRRFRNSPPPPASDGARSPPPSSVRSSGSMRKTMRSPPPQEVHAAESLRESLRPQKHETRGVLSRGSLRGDPDVHRERRRFSSSSESEDGRGLAPVKRRQDAYAESLGSYASDLDSIVEDERRQQTRRRRKSAPIVEEEEEEDRRRREDQEDIRRKREEAKMRLRRGEEADEELRKLRQEEEEIKLRREEETRLRREEEEMEKRRAERRKTLSLLESPRIAQEEVQVVPRSPARTHFAGTTLEAHRHSPPPRSVSPAKSALKHPISERVPGDTSPIASDRKRTYVRVSFSDEESVVSFSHSRPPAVTVDELAPRPGLPVFGSVKERDIAAEMETWRKRETTLVEPAPPVAANGDPISFGSEAVPELVLIEPTPMEEKKESVAMSTVFEKSPAAPLETSALTQQPLHRKQVGTVSLPITPVPGSFPETSFVPTADDAASDSDSSSMYEDALEDVTPPAEPTMNPLIVATTPSAPPQSTASSPPQSPRQTNAGNRTPIPRPPSPPLPASFSLPTPTPSRRRSLTPPPRRRSSQRQTSQPPRHDDDDDDAASVSSFRRVHPRATCGFRSSMRIAAPIAPARRFSEDSSDEEAGGVRRRFGLGGGGEGRSWKSRYEDSSDDEGGVRPVTARSSVRPATAASSPGKLRKQSFKKTSSAPIQGEEEKTKKKGLFGFLGGKQSRKNLEKRSESAALDSAFPTGEGEARKEKKRWWKFGH
ncbi:hypothetical protein BZA05DRAFT_388116 [Tricharina praecox]|uniref:uncharacterized protein n=1 Tax=Tricharina praecox TaxID=43433 RepID=UPI00221F6C3B|nr:uncharacterized protein BZA05DRAFT_388116 [Tricharina praecox]KAI5856327.1 hypothetical protein BZA05DRAFT_388116 [Tricharina praecox]